MSKPKTFSKGLRFKNLSIVTRNMLWTSLYIIITGAIVIGSSFYIQDNVLTKQLQSDSGKIMGTLVNKVSVEDAVAVKGATDRNADIQKKLISIFDELSVLYPNVAQGYIFGPELEDGNKTSIVAMPTAVLDMFAEENLNLGDLYEQPKIHADAVREMLETKKLVHTKAYT
ncbi:methyl-accepting chemotaxis protein, partial [Paenibacillus glucanolyticus]